MELGDPAVGGGIAALNDVNTQRVKGDEGYTRSGNVGYLVGSFIQGLYLLVSLNVFGRHFNEAFSTIAVSLPTSGSRGARHSSLP